MLRKLISFSRAGTFNVPFSHKNPEVIRLWEGFSEQLNIALLELHDLLQANNFHTIIVSDQKLQEQNVLEHFKKHKIERNLMNYFQFMMRKRFSYYFYSTMIKQIALKEIEVAFASNRSNPLAVKEMKHAEQARANLLREVRNISNTIMLIFNERIMPEKAKLGEVERCLFFITDRLPLLVEDIAERMVDCLARQAQCSKRNEAQQFWRFDVEEMFRIVRLSSVTV